jgi:hypothetical protein
MAAYGGIYGGPGFAGSVGNPYATGPAYGMGTASPYGSSAPQISYLIAPGGNGNQSLPGYLSNSSTGTLLNSPDTAAGYDPYTSSGYTFDYSPTGGYLRGAADVTAAFGHFMLTTQKARLVAEQVTRSQIDTRRKIWEEAQWERMNTIFTEDYRESLIRTEVRRARLEPPLNEIWSGRTLNVLLKVAAAQQAKGVRGPNIAIPEDVLKHINLTTGVGGKGNIGLFRNDTLQWPLPLQGPEFADIVKSLNQRIPEAREQARLNNSVAPGLLKDIQKDVQRLSDTLRNSVSEMPPADYIESKRYVNMLNEAVQALSDPNVQNYLTNKYLQKTKNIADLVDGLTRVNGLEFAPAAPGDEASYRALYQLFHAYDTGMNQLNTSAPAPKPTDSGSSDK